MKYMGSKRGMLSNGLGEALSMEMPQTKRFVDLFCGSGSVAWYAATRWGCKVIACDLQQYATDLASSVISRDRPFDNERALKGWIKRATDRVTSHPIYLESRAIQDRLGLLRLPRLVSQSRRLCSNEECGPVQAAYGGHYYSPLQALWIDSLRASLPRERDARLVAIASLIQVGSQCAASPGHTAQPFQINGNSDQFLLQSWRRDPVDRLRENFFSIGRLTAKTRGQARVCDAVDYTKNLKDGDLVFIDPPYSAAQYSRFYHVLEVIAIGRPVEVSGVGRYPGIKFRPKSDFSMRTRAFAAMAELLQKVAASGARAIVTFPSGQASNGLSGNSIVEIAEQYFRVEHQHVTGLFSTLGGNRVNRVARTHSKELILTLSPR